MAHPSPPDPGWAGALLWHAEDRELVEVLEQRGSVLVCESIVSPVTDPRRVEVAIANVGEWHNGWRFRGRHVSDRYEFPSRR